MRSPSMAWSVVVLVLFIAAAAPAELQWSEGSWRLELSGGAGLSTGSDRTGDWLLKGTVEYEVPATSHLTLGLRMIPLFIYDQEWRDADTVWGAGVGLGGRLYFSGAEYKGLFTELNVHVIGHDNYIVGNSSNINFLTGFGLGYKFASNWHAALRWEHISNANLASHNAGSDMITLGIGYTF